MEYKRGFIAVVTLIGESRVLSDDCGKPYFYETEAEAEEAAYQEADMYDEGQVYWSGAAVIALPVPYSTIKEV